MKNQGSGNVLCASCIVHHGYDAFITTGWVDTNITVRVEEHRHLVPHSWSDLVLFSGIGQLFVTAQEHGAGSQPPFATT